jgi:hypothetical protein
MVSGVPVYYAGGGGGAPSDTSATGSGGLGGGGDSGNSTIAASTGSINTGGGGGGNAAVAPSAGAGGSGVVIIRYLTAGITATGGLVTTDGAYTVHQFTASSAFSASVVGTGPMELVSAVVTSSTIPSTARIIVLEEDVSPIIVNTDIQAWASADSGSNYTQITLVNEGIFSGTKRILAGTSTLVNTGSKMRYKITAPTSQQLNIHGTGLLWQ